MACYYTPKKFDIYTLVKAHTQPYCSQTESVMTIRSPQVMATMEVGVMVKNTLSPRALVNYVVANARGMLDFMRRTFE